MVQPRLLTEERLQELEDKAASLVHGITNAEALELLGHIAALESRHGASHPGRFIRSISLEQACPKAAGMTPERRTAHA